jgi:PAB-dependent poly(A)-specific ribonuclease subunit 2
LYKAYHEFEEGGTFDEKLEELYREGKANVRRSCEKIEKLC